MRLRVLQPANLAILATYLLLSAVPFAPALFGKSIDHPLRILLIEFAVWLGLWVLMKRPAHFHWLLIPAFLGFPVEMYLLAHYQQGISVHHLGIIAESSPREALEFLGQQAWLLVGLAVSTGAWWTLIWWAARKTHELDMPVKPRLLGLGLICLSLCAWLYGLTFGVERAKNPGKVTGAPALMSALATTSTESTSDTDDDEDEPGKASQATSSPVSAKVDPTPSFPWAGFAPLPAWARLDFGKEQFSRTWPLGPWVLAHDFWKERAYLAELAGQGSEFRFGASQDRGNPGPQVFVLVIGESSRYDRWSLNGYGRETNPLLKLEPNLVPLSNVISAISATRLAVPVLLTRKPAIDSLKPGFTEKSILSAYKEAGFKTYWLSNQLSYGKFDTPVSVFAREAEVTQFPNLGDFINKSSFDQVLLEPLRNALADPAPRKFIVLHTLGNHWNYSHRHPPEFEQWKPSLSGLQTPNHADRKLRENIANSYDNSVLYADWFLSRTIAELKAAGPKVSAMLFISDHGENLHDGQCNLVLHGSNTKFDFHVPAMVWYSDAYRRVFPGKIEQLQKHRHARLSFQNVFHSVADMGGVNYPGERSAWSLFSKTLENHTRYVDSYGWTDYDQASFEGDCSEVMARGGALTPKK